jgi:hypothetical protein
MTPQRKYPISLETEKIKNIFKNAFLKENFKKWPHWPHISTTSTPSDDMKAKDMPIVSFIYILYLHGNRCKQNASLI